MFISSRTTATRIHPIRGCAVAGVLLGLALSAQPALANKSPAPELQANPASVQVNAELAVCPGQTFSQPFESLGDTNYYTLVEGSEFNQAGEGWDLYGGAKIVEATRPDGSSGGVLDMPNGAVAVSPPVCVTLQYPTARTWVEAVEGNGSETIAVAYNINLSRLSLGAVSLGSLSTKTGGGWQLSKEFQLNPQLGGRTEGVREARFVYATTGRGTEFHISGLYVDPRFSN
jgi:hypothetical protein